MIADLSYLKIVLLVGEYTTRRKSVLLVGNEGTGKTHLAIALGDRAFRKGAESGS